MDDMSNKTLAWLVMLAIVISVGSTFVVLNSLRPGGRISGLDIFTGNVTVNVTNVTDFEFDAGNNSIDFGSLPAGSNESTDDDSPFPMVVENGGSVPVDGFIADDATPLFFDPGSAVFIKARFHPSFPGAFSVPDSDITYVPLPNVPPGAPECVFDHLGVGTQALLDFLIVLAASEPLGPHGTIITATGIASAAFGAPGTCGV